YLAMRDRGEDFSAFCWRFVDDVPLQGSGTHFPATTPLSATISRALKQRGFSFVGPTIVYAWMQATGIVNDHHERCFRRAQVGTSETTTKTTKTTTTT
ncbi:MAG TPA: DNA-3-methyladenine glycosylase I, partial [Myxococcota bacterium]